MKCFLVGRIRAVMMFFFVCVGLAYFCASASVYAMSPEAALYGGSSGSDSSQAVSQGAPSDSDSPQAASQGAPSDSDSPQAASQGAPSDEGLNREKSPLSNGLDGDNSYPVKGTCGGCTWEYKKEKCTKDGLGAQERERVVLYIRPTNGTSGTLDTWENTPDKTPPWIIGEGVSTQGRDDDLQDSPIVSTPRAMTKRIVIEGNVKAQTCRGMFRRFFAVESIVGLANLDTKGVTQMEKMFFRCLALQELDVSGFDTSRVENMSEMFSECEQLVSLPGIENWETGAVVDMDSLFHRCSRLASLDLQKWNTAKVKCMKSMFESCLQLTSIGDVSKWNTAAVENMSSMFAACVRLGSDSSKDLAQHLGKWDVKAVKNMQAMFSRSGFVSLDLNAWNVGAVENMLRMFADCKNLKELKVDTWNVKAVKDMVSMFKGCSVLTSLNLSVWDTSTARRYVPRGSELTSQVYMLNMFNAMPGLKTIYLGHKFVFANGADCFGDASDLERSDTSGDSQKAKVKKCWAHIEGDADEKRIVEFFSDVRAFVMSHNALVKKEAKGAKKKQGNGFEKYVRVDTQEEVVLEDTKDFYGGYAWGRVSNNRENGEKTCTTRELNECRPQTARLAIGKSKTGAPIKIIIGVRMFENFEKLSEVDLSGLDAKSANNMAHMFTECSSRASLDPKNLNASSVTNMGFMSENCRRFAAIISASDDASQHRNTVSLRSMNSAFERCESSTQAEGLQCWDTSAVTDMHSVSKCCGSPSFHLKRETGLSDVEATSNNQWMQVKDGTLANLGEVVPALLADFMKTHNGGKGSSSEWYVRQSVYGVYGQRVWGCALFGGKNFDREEMRVFCSRSLTGVLENVRQAIAYGERGQLPLRADSEYGKCHSSTAKIVFEGDVETDDVVPGDTTVTTEDEHVKPGFAEGSFDPSEDPDVLDDADLKLEDGDEDDDGGADIDDMPASSIDDMPASSIDDMPASSIDDMPASSSGVAVPASSSGVTRLRVSKQPIRRKRSVEEPTERSIEQVKASRAPRATTSNAATLTYETEGTPPVDVSLSLQSEQIASDGMPQGCKVINLPADKAAIRSIKENTGNGASSWSHTGEELDTQKVKEAAVDANGKPVAAAFVVEILDTYTITFDLNAPFEAEGQKTRPTSQTVVHDSSVKMPEVALSDPNYKFTGWNTKADGTGVSYNANDEIKNIAANMTLYAQWEKVETPVPQLSDSPVLSVSVLSASSSLPQIIGSTDGSASTGAGSSGVSESNRETSSAASRDVAAPAQQAVGWFLSIENGVQKWYYYGKDGKKLVGQHELVGGFNQRKNWFYFDEVTGAQIRGWKYIDYQNKWCYYSDGDGTMLKGQHELVGGFNQRRNWFYFDEVTGAEIRGWKCIDYQNKWCYYSDGDGTMLKGQYELVGGFNQRKNWFYFDEVTGAELRNCWKEIPSQSKTCYYASDGAMYKGFCLINGREHYFNEEIGALVW